MAAAACGCSCGNWLGGSPSGASTPRRERAVCCRLLRRVGEAGCTAGRRHVAREPQRFIGFCACPRRLLSIGGRECEAAEVRTHGGAMDGNPVRRGICRTGQSVSCVGRVARILSPDAHSGPPGLRSLGDGCASTSMSPLAVYAARGHGQPFRCTHSGPARGHGCGRGATARLEGGPTSNRSGREAAEVRKHGGAMDVNVERPPAWRAGSLRTAAAARPRRFASTAGPWMARRACN
jgi:hypothetical protein